MPPLHLELSASVTLEQTYFCALWTAQSVMFSSSSTGHTRSPHPHLEECRGLLGLSGVLWLLISPYTPTGAEVSALSHPLSVGFILSIHFLISF